MIPKDNMRDIRELDREVAENVRFIPVTGLGEVLSLALVRPAKTQDIHTVLPVLEENPILAEIKEDGLDKSPVKYPPRRKRPYTNANS